ncbi:MAG: AraC family transcriptional regulator, partial [bacterium]
MTPDALAARALSHLQRTPSDPALVEPVAGMLLLRHARPTSWTATVYQPVLCLILQGRKETAARDRSVALAPGDALVVSHDLPVVARIAQAAPGQPYIAMIVALDLPLL